MRIIQISGKGRVGKTTLANLVAKYSFELGYTPIILPFAESIKDQATQQGITKENDSSKYREFCQKLGAEKRKEDADYWVTRTFSKMQEYMVKEIDNKREEKSYYEYVIIQDDVRYMNELALGRELAATQIFVSQGERDLSESNAEWRNHESETMANEIETSFTLPNSEYEDIFDVIIFNDGSTQDLEHEVKINIEEWLEYGYIDLEFVDEAE